MYQRRTGEIHFFSNVFPKHALRCIILFSFEKIKIHQTKRKIDYDDSVANLTVV